LTRHPWYALKSAYSPNGRHIALVVIHLDQRRPSFVELWDSKLDKMEWRSSGYADTPGFGGMFFSPDGEFIVSTGAVNPGRDAVFVVRLWKAGTGREAGEFELDVKKEYDNWICSMAVSPDGKHLLIGTYKGHVVLCKFPFPPAGDKPAEKKR
jgi:WD40 repeat protein